jgi:hypothetical protein
MKVEISNSPSNEQILNFEAYSVEDINLIITFLETLEKNKRVVNTDFPPIFYRDYTPITNPPIITRMTEGYTTSTITGTSNTTINTIDPKYRHVYKVSKEDQFDPNKIVTTKEVCDALNILQT